MERTALGGGEEFEKKGGGGIMGGEGGKIQARRGGSLPTSLEHE